MRMRPDVPLAVLLALGLTVFADNVDAQRTVDVRGYFVGAGVNGTLTKFDDNSDVDHGPGVSIHTGYNFSSKLGVFLSGTGSLIAVDPNDVTLGHADLGLRFSMPAAGSALVPYAELAFTYLTAERESPGGDVDFSGRGGTAAAGFNYFVSQKMAFDANLRLTKGEFTSIKVKGKRVSNEDSGLTTGRMNIGLAWYPGSGCGGAVCR